MERRDFLAVLGTGSLAAALGGCAASRGLPVRARDGRVRLRLDEHPALARPGGGATLDVEGRTEPLMVVVQKDGSPLVFSSVCTHQGCVVERQGSRMVCPCHGSTYDTDGSVLVGPAPRALRRIPSRVVDGVLEIDTGRAS